MTPTKRAEIERMIALLGRKEPTVYEGEAEFILKFSTRDALTELLAEIDRLNSERTSLIERWEFRWLEHDWQHHTQHEPDLHDKAEDEQRVPPPRVE